LLYAETASYFARIIRNHLKPEEQPYQMLDVGTFKGELVSNVVKELGDSFHFHITGIDINEEALSVNTVVDDKIMADIAEMPFSEKSFDIAEARYVLSWNTLERQKLILREINRVSKRFAIVQHVGADRTGTEGWQKAMHTLMNGGVEKLSRQECYFSSGDEIEKIMTDSGIRFQNLQDRRVDNVSDIFIERYKLNKVEIRKMLDILGNKDYIYQTTWLIGEQG
jgi:ubiquinone/menaquinone biosynthesis C-methylase UbiE